MPVLGVESEGATVRTGCRGSRRSHSCIVDISLHAVATHSGVLLLLLPLVESPFPLLLLPLLGLFKLSWLFAEAKTSWSSLLAALQRLLLPREPTKSDFWLANGLPMPVHSAAFPSSDRSMTTEGAFVSSEGSLLSLLLICAPESVFLLWSQRTVAHLQKLYEPVSRVASKPGAGLL